ncbi:MAG: ABC transporter substrate-binding protein [Hamadaea sp.]|nr:ABC transporter substrate-binding protein [Hamadaea sp.]
MKPQRTLTTLAVAALLVAGCGRDGSSKESTEGPATAPSAVSADFGDLKSVCQPGKPTSSPAQGVTASEIKLGVMSDVGFTKNAEFFDAAKVFSSWCNDLGGINGRKVVVDQHDTKMMEVRQRMIEACRDDFALVGGGAALDGMGVKDRLSCLLPDFPGQTVQAENVGSDLQVAAAGSGSSYFYYAGFYSWLLKEAYPGSASAVGLINGDSPVTKVIGQKTEEGIRAAGGTVAYSDLYPASGISDWTPYAQSIKSKNVKGLVFNGQYTQLAKLEQALTNIGYKLDWIDANNNAYGPQFVSLAGNQVLSTQNNVLDLSGVYPLENAAGNPATKQVVDLFAKYAPSAQVSLPAIRAFSAWLLFAKSAATCGDNLTRKCVYDAARTEKAWTGGGLQAPADLTNADAPIKCFNVEKATPDGWQPADFKPNTGAYRCDAPVTKFTGSYAKPVTLADVGKSMADVK